MEEKPLTIIRFFAFIIDVLLVALSANFIIAVIGLFISIETHFTLVLAIGLCVATVFFLVEEYLFQTSIGKWIFSFRVVTDNGGDISLQRAVLRSLTKPLFPIEGLVLMFGKSKRRLGDRLAKTRVERMALSGEKKIIKIVGGIAAVYLVINGVLMVSAMAYKNTDICKTAMAYYSENRDQADFKGITDLKQFPDIVSINNEFGLVVFGAQQGNQPIYLQFSLKKQKNQWQVVSHLLTREGMGRGYGISHSSKVFKTGGATPASE